MHLLAVRRWQWMLIGAVVGLLLGTAREASSRFSDELAAYGGRRLGQPEFERALVTKLQGQAQFRELVVYPYRLGGSSSGIVQLHVVAGLFWDGRTDEENGQLAAHWEPAYFVASSPFYSLGQPQGGGKPLGEGGKFSNVLEYLASLRGSGQVQYSYARWWWVSRPWFVWTLAGFVLVGVIWPTLVNLLTYGTLRRPRTEPEISIPESGNGSTAATSPAPSPQLDLAALDMLERQMEADLSAAPVSTPVPVPVVTRSMGAAKLSTADNGTRAQPAPVQQKEFGEAREDFYPTELHGKQDQ